MIEKIINNYLTNALIKCFRTAALLRNIELLVIPRKNEISIYAKDRKFAENNYKKVIQIKEESTRTIFASKGLYGNT